MNFKKKYIFEKYLQGSVFMMFSILKYWHFHFKSDYWRIEREEWILIECF